MTLAVDQQQKPTEESAVPILNGTSTNSAVVLSSGCDDDEQQQRQRQPNHSTITTTPTLTSMQTKFIIILLAICNFFIANGVSLQGPFFPKEAEKKGATPLIYSSIFAIYELVMLVTSFLFGNFVDRFRPNLMSGFGLTITGISTTVFGLLTMFHQELEFVITAFLLRIIESLGATAFATSSYSFISVCFPDQTATMFATMEMCFGLGVITGPVIGGFLYDLGGFLYPFLVIGIAVTIFGIILVSHPVGKLFEHGKLLGQLQAGTIAADHGGADDQQEVNNLIISINDSEESEDLTTVSMARNATSADQPEVTLKNFLSSIIVLIDAFIITTALTLMGFNGATLEPFLRHQQITNETLQISLMFVALGASYSFSALLWGKFSDRFPALLITTAMFGSIITMIGLLLLGPVPFLSGLFKPNLWTVCTSMILFGIGTSSKQVAAYTHAMNYTIKQRKFPANQKTYGFISGMFFSCISFGGFIGPIIGGSLVQWWNFQYATLVMFSLESLVLLILMSLQFCFYRKIRINPET